MIFGQIRLNPDELLILGFIDLSNNRVPAMKKIEGPALLCYYIYE